jgi:hypothetical protein
MRLTCPRLSTGHMVVKGRHNMTVSTTQTMISHSITDATCHTGARSHPVTLPSHTMPVAHLQILRLSA